MNYKQAILNTFKHFGYSVLTFAVLGTLQYLSNGDTLTKLLTHDGLPTTITVIAIPLVKDAIVLVQNFAKVHLVSE